MRDIYLIKPPACFKIENYTKKPANNPRPILDGTILNGNYQIALQLSISSPLNKPINYTINKYAMSRIFTKKIQNTVKNVNLAVNKKHLEFQDAF
ncbi:MAG: hypothetical protein HUJ63_00860 [Enterococcus sp.]|nr:hypothetical protein [Enterococcus sp.]